MAKAKKANKVTPAPTPTPTAAPAPEPTALPPAPVPGPTQVPKKAKAKKKNKVPPPSLAPTPAPEATSSFYPPDATQAQAQPSHIPVPIPPGKKAKKKRKEKKAKAEKTKGGDAPEISSLSDLHRNQRLKSRILEAKLREEHIQAKHREREYRRRLIRRQKRVQDELEYLHFPTLAGLYFDGFHIRHFLLRKEWADIFNEMEEINTRKKELDPRETWQELVQRNFWPPRVYGGIFRTRGIYMDYSEVMRDPPRTPPDPHSVPPRAETGTEEEASGDFNKRKPCVPGRKFASHKDREQERNKHDFYFDEDLGKFILIGPDTDLDSLYFDCKFMIWRKKRPILRYAGDYYWDSDKGEFFLKIRERAGMYYYDTVANVWKMRENKGPSCNGLEPRDFYFNELLGEWVYRGDAPTEGNGGAEPYVYDENGARFAQRIPITGPDDFFFDESGVGMYQPKEGGQGTLYAYDGNYGAWRKIGAENKKTKLKPGDYYWSDADGVYKIKNGPRMEFEFDANNKFYRRKKLLKGPHHPANWKWNIKTKEWELKKNNRSHFFNEMLKWEPERSYEKPWLDNDAMEHSRQQHNMEIYNKALADQNATAGTGGAPQEPPKEGAAATAGGMPPTEPGQPAPPGPGGMPPGAPPGPGQPAAGTAAIQPQPSTVTPYGKRKVDLAMADAAKAEWGDEAFKNHPSRIPFNSPARALANFKTKGAAARPVSSLYSEFKPREGENTDIFGNLVLEKQFDRKRLRCGNLGGVVHEKELKAFFYAATAVNKPKEREEGDEDDFLYIQFDSDIAASAAYRTMQNVDIKGQSIQLSYPRREQK